MAEPPKAGAYRGYFTLEELQALGFSGDARTDWLKGGKDRLALDPKLKFPAGYYRLPGSASEAVYVDPKSGSVPFQFFDMLDKSTGDLKRDPISGLPTAYLQDNNVWQEPGFFKQIREGLDAQKKQEALGYDPQEAQNRRLGAQEAARQPDTYKPGVKNTAGSSAGAYARFIAQGGTDDLLKMPGFEGYDPQRVTTLKDSLAHSFMQRLGAQTGLKALNQPQAGDPREMERLKSTYEALDPAKRSQWLFYQDPGNLTPELRDLRAQARAGERELIQHANAASYTPEYRYLYAGGGGKAYQAVVKRGNVSQTEAGTGREKFFGNVPLKAEMVKGKYDRIGDFGKRLGGGLAGGFLGFFGSGGNLLGAFSGAYQGAGGPAPQGGVAGGLFGGLMGATTGGGWGAAIGAYSGAGGVKGLRTPNGGFNTWRGSAGQIPGAAQIGSAIAFAKFNGPKPRPA